MSRLASELETILQQLISEYGKLLRHLELHQAAMKKLDMRAMDESARQQEAARLRITALDNRRRGLAKELALSLRMGEPPTLARLADAMPQARQRLLTLRGQLKDVVEQISSRATISGRLAGAVLGHLNTAVRILAGAVEQAGVYTREGVARVSPRIGAIEAVG